MKIQRFDLTRLRNDEFFQYMTRMREMIKAATPAALRVEAVYGDFNHFDPAKRVAAERLVIIFNIYGNVAARGNDEETAAVYNLLKELTEKYTDDCSLLGIPVWITELDRRNRAVETAMIERFDETTGRTTFSCVPAASTRCMTNGNRHDELSSKFLAQGKCRPYFHSETNNPS